MVAHYSFDDDNLNDASGNDLSFDVRFTDVWAKRDGCWQMVAWQWTKLP